MRDIIIIPRSESKKLLIFRSLNSRGNLTEKEKRYYRNLEKGFEGELILDDWIHTLTNEFLVLNDLTFDYNNNEFQIDSLMISQNKIFILDSKNYEGDYYYNAGRFYRKGGSEIQDSLPQLRRCESLFRRMLQDKYSIDGYLVFVNSEFHLYQAPLDEPIIYPTQIKRFFNELDSIPSKLNKSHYQLAEKFMGLAIEKSSKEKIPEYHYGDLKKGFCCGSCHSLNVYCEGNFVVCQICGFKEKFKTAVLSCVEEIRLLFPDLRITTNLVHEWCTLTCSKKTIHRILSNNFLQLGKGVSTYYVKKR